MAPLLMPGDDVLYAPGRKVALGDVVVARHPFDTQVLLIKRLERRDARGYAWLVGLNPAESTDSRSFGALPPDRLLGPVTCRLAPRRP